MSAAKQKGTKWETDLVRSLGGFFEGRYGLAPRRVAQEGFLDSGDIHGISPFVAQAKNYKSWEEAIRLGLDGAEKQKGRAGESYGVAFVKRVRRSVGDGYAVMTVATFARLLLRLRRAEALLALHARDEVQSVHERESAEDERREYPR
ncbi:hypothetical protein [Arthrobacter sp. B2a2-09]|uniref:hypothetical protein n=1 Tax=Arthrobacter sp. B2a2-09 TaxID=2952822 RepID=UPI0022CD59DD|nr:hypothetical protein [Arthrobacter sp. B2a2-09]MCZ9884619.1 hypothetical protein [Arthrobacter sp. B2a2-09]